jgi:hypothetical protein
MLENRDVPSYLAAEFPGQGVWLYSPDGSWRQLTAANVSLVATDSYGEVVAEVPAGASGTTGSTPGNC